MPEKPLTVATYAAGASLAAITLIYVFAPTYLLDSENADRSGSLRKRGVVGLSNPANDCFINSILQALAGLGDLRLYLIRETHRRSLEDDVNDSSNNNVSSSSSLHASASARSIYSVAVPHDGLPEWKVLGLQGGVVTAGLKRILNQLNERPIAKKTASAMPFVRDLEAAFRQRISRQQQDAQEFLQVVAERLCDEYHAGQRARRAARQREAGLGGSSEDAQLVGRRLEGVATDGDGTAAAAEEAAAESINPGSGGEDTEDNIAAQSNTNGGHAEDDEDDDDDEEGFPMEGKFESQIECLTCGFKPRPKEDTFCTLTLNVPQVSSTTLNACFDGIFKTEYIDDFKCEKCRLVHALGVYKAELSRLPDTDSAKAEDKRRAVELLQHAIDTDPERAPDGVVLPDARNAPKRRIARHIRMTSFPKILAVHLSRSIYERSQSQKNSAKVAFPERLPLGGLLHRRKYKLLAVVAHKGSHHSGHYESFRRQNLYAPYSTPNAFGGSGVYGKTASASASASPASRTPRLDALQKEGGGGSGDGDSISSPAVSTPNLSIGGATGEGTPDTTPSSSSADDLGNPTGPARPSSSTSRLASLSLSMSPHREKDRDTDSSSLRSVARSTLSRMAPSSIRSGSKRQAAAEDQQQQHQGNLAPTTSSSLSNKTTGRTRKKKKSQDNMWWRLSDEKVKEAATKDVLGMQREVYLLFYEMEKEDE